MSANQKTYRKTYPISWEQIHRDSKALAWRLVEIKTWILFPWDTENRFVQPIIGLQTPSNR